MTRPWRNISRMVFPQTVFCSANCDMRWKDLIAESPKSKPALGLNARSAFMLFWTGETVSMFGTQITLLALPLTAVLVLHASPTQLGFVRFAEAFPYVLFTLLFGAWADRRRRKPILILTN